jgi:hypothetical protein
MYQYFTEILLWLFVVNLGIAFGAGLYEQRIILPQWFSRSSQSSVRVNSAAMRGTDTGEDSGRLSRRFRLPCLPWPI